MLICYRMGHPRVPHTHTELRKESRRLENEVDQKLVSFSKLGSTFSHRDTRYGGIYTHHKSQILAKSHSLLRCSSDPGMGGTGHVFDTLALEIEQLLTKVEYCSVP